MPENVLRDLNKVNGFSFLLLTEMSFGSNPTDIKTVIIQIFQAYVGFSWGSNRKKEELCAIATGNWGCGVFAGNPQLKSIIQLLAAGEVGRDLAYFTFGDTQLCHSMTNVHEFLSENAITVGLYTLRILLTIILF
jgi:hypothetical protein